MKVGIICASDKELKPFLGHIENSKTTEKAMLKIHEGSINNVDVAILFCGVCKTNAAIATQILIDCYNVNAVINAGTAGGIDNQINIFDTVIATEAAHHDMHEEILTEFHPFMPSIYFSSDKKLLGLSKEITGYKIHFGKMVTGEMFITNEGREEIISKFNPLSVDMETASIAQVCHANKIPFIAISTITDNAKHSGTENFETNCVMASEISKMLLLNYLIKLVKNKAAQQIKGVNMIKQTIDDISFNMAEEHDFSFLNKYGKVFCVFDQNDSGNISFGVDNGTKKYFIKVAGAKTAETLRSTEEAIENLKAAVPLYYDLECPQLIKIAEHFEHDDLYVAVFEWTEGDCLFDHWNFDFYNDNPSIVPPKQRFKNLPCEKKIKVFQSIFEFLVFAQSKGYVAVDFYDGSIIYDFDTDKLMICDIDFFRKGSFKNEKGENFIGTKRLKAPEEYILGATIDKQTNVFTLGALIMHFFGSYTNEEIKEMYSKNEFFPCRYETWELSKPLYNAVLKAVCKDKNERYNSIKDFYNKWESLAE